MRMHRDHGIEARVHLPKATLVLSACWRTLDPKVRLGLETAFLKWLPYPGGSYHQVPQQGMVRRGRRFGAGEKGELSPQQHRMVGLGMAGHPQWWATGNHCGSTKEGTR